jgi:uncharacterized protein (TIGR03067 family)
MEVVAMQTLSPVVKVVAFLLLLSIHGAIGRAAETDAAGHAERIRGIWQAVSVEGASVEGAEVSRSTKLWVIVAEKTLTIRVNSRVVAEAAYRVNAKRTPAEIDLKFQGQDTPGVYEVDGESLKLCLGGGGTRPARFAGTEGAMLLVLQRHEYKLIRSSGAGQARTGRPLPDVAVAVLDDCDRDFRGEGPHGDGIRLLSREGKEFFALRGLNNCETIGANHAVAIDAKRGRIYFRQLVAHRVTALDFSGNIVFEADLRAGALAVDPATGNVWCLTGDSRGDWHADTVVLNDRGELVAAYPIDGFDIVHDPKTDAFWIVGTSIAKVDRRGQVVFRKSPGGWARVSVAVNPRDGSAWIAERQHPDVPDSANLLLRLDSKGNELQRIDLAPNNPFCVACDPETGTAWVVDLRKAILRVPIGTHQPERLDIPAMAIAIGPETGQIWATTETEVLHLAKQGKSLARYPFEKRSGQSWISVR